MNIFQKLSEKPWLPQPEGLRESHAMAYVEAGDTIDSVIATTPERIALRFFLGVVGVIFFLLIITFLDRSQYPDFEALAGLPWQPLTNPTQLWVNTAILLFSSLALHTTFVAARRNALKTVFVTLTLGALSAFVFITAQLMLWQELTSVGYGVSMNPANSFFYLLTGIHGVHLIGGLCVLIHVYYTFLSHKSLDILSSSIALCTSYWNFLFVIWLILFGLLASTPETYKAIAAICGF